MTKSNNVDVKEKIKKVIEFLSSFESKINFEFFTKEKYLRTFDSGEAEFFTKDAYKYLFKLLFTNTITPYVFESIISLSRNVYLLSNKKISVLVLEFIIEIFGFSDPEIIDKKELVKAIISYMEKIDFYKLEKRKKQIN